MSARIAPSHRMHGFTLVELIVTIAIVAIVAAIALPSYREFMLRMNTTTLTNDLVGALNIARTEAVRRGRSVAVISNGGNWNNGWQIVVAKTVSGSLEDPPTSPGATAAACSGSIEDNVPMCVQHRDAMQSGFSVLSKASGAGGSDSIAIFGPTGALRGATAFDFSICRPAGDEDPAESRRIQVAASGIISSRRDTTGAPAGGCN